MLKSLKYTCLVSTAHVSLHDSGQWWKVAGQPNFFQWDSNRLSHWNRVLRGTIGDYSLNSQSTQARNEPVFIHHGWPAALLALWRLPGSLHVYTGLDHLVSCSPGGLSWRPG